MAYNKCFAKEIKDYIDKNYSDWRLSMNTFVGMVGFSTVYINKVFKENYGVTPIEYLRKVRLEKAKELLDLGVPIGRVVYETGYNSLRTFYRIFEKGTGMPPGVYKRRALKTYEQFKNVINLHDVRPIDYAQKACDYIMFKYDPMYLPPLADQADKITLYGYAQGLFLEGMYNTYKQCTNKKYMNYICSWLDTVQSNGILRKYTQCNDLFSCTVDAYMPIYLFLKLYQETKKPEYMDFAENYIHILDTWNTHDGIFYHGKNENTGRIMPNSVYMVCPTMTEYAKIKDSFETYDKAVCQAIGMFEKMRNPQTGLLYQAYDPDKKEKWANSETGMLDKCWGRGLGYYLMGVLDMLENIPKENENYDKLCEIVKKILCSLQRYQTHTGRWYVIPDKCNEEGNWLENSSTCMYAYSYAKAINLGILSAEYAVTAVKAYSGIIDNIGYDEDGGMLMRDVSDTVHMKNDDYEERSCDKDNLHGIGAYVLMCAETEKLLNNI